MSATTTRGKFIVLEGIDGSGTTSVGKKLASSLATDGEPTVFTWGPSDNPIGRLIRRYLAKEIPNPGNFAMQNLFTADRHDHIENIILPILESGKHVVCDRFFWSTAAYQTVDLKKSISCSAYAAVDLHDSLKNTHIQGLVPDITLLLNVAPDVARERRMERGDTKDELYEDEKTQTYVAHNYLAIVNSTMKSFYPGYTKKKIHIVDASDPFNAVFKECFDLVSSLIKE